MKPEQAPRIRVVGVVLRDAAGRVLTVRKRGTRRFMLPGGKPEGDETPDQTAVRECAEELGASLEPASLRLLGRFEAAAANEPGHRIESTVLVYPDLPPHARAAEIAELRWLDPTAPLPADLAPLLADHVVPALLRAEGQTEQ